MSLEESERIEINDEAWATQSSLSTEMSAQKERSQMEIDFNSDGRYPMMYD